MMRSPRAITLLYSRFSAFCSRKPLYQLVTSGTRVSFEATNALQAGARPWTWMMSHFRLRTMREITAALRAMIAGFLLATSA